MVSASDLGSAEVVSALDLGSAEAADLASELSWTQVASAQVASDLATGKVEMVKELEMELELEKALGSPQSYSQGRYLALEHR